MRVWLRLVSCALAVLLATATGCAPRRSIGTIDIGVRTANDHAPFYIADRQQLYRQQGLDVVIHLVPSNTEIIEALQRGDLQMGAVPATTAIAAIAAGSPLHIVAMTGRGSDGILVRREDGYLNVADLRGKRIATIKASILEVLLRYTLQQAGLDPDRDVELVYMSQLGDLVSALKTGQVEACSNTEPFMTDAERQGWGHILAYYSADWPDHPCCVVLARDDLLAEHPEVVRDILAVHCTAVDWANAHPAETAQIIVDYLESFDTDLVLASLDTSKMSIDYHLLPGEIERMAALMVEQGLLAAAPSSDRLLATGPLDEVTRGAP